MMQGAATVTGFFTDLQAVWDQLLNFRPSPCCLCGKCTYGVNDKITTFQHQDSLMQFLNGLNDSYSQVRTQRGGLCVVTVASLVMLWKNATNW